MATIALLLDEVLGEGDAFHRSILRGRLTRIGQGAQGMSNMNRWSVALHRVPGLSRNRGVWLRRLVARLVAMGIALALVQTAAGQGASSGTEATGRPIRLVVPFPSGPADLLARLYAERLSGLLARPVVVDNRVGATGTIGTDLVAKAAADGNTVLFTVDLPIVMAPALFRTPYDPRVALLPVAAVGESAQLIMVHPGTGLRSIDDLVRVARARPGELTYASAGNASPGHLCGEMLASRLDIRMTHVPYRGAGPAAQAVLAGEVSLFCGPLTAALPHLPGGRMVGLAVTGERASPLVPGMPVMADRLPGFVVSNWYGFFLPAGTPAAVANPLAQAVRRVASDRGLRERLDTLAIEELYLDGPALARRVEADLAKWTRVIGQTGVRAD
jgi:tripartite-type tricarboxylate transporter receptor subunit TctC